MAADDAGPAAAAEKLDSSGKAPAADPERDGATAATFDPAAKPEAIPAPPAQPVHGAAAASTPAGARGAPETVAHLSAEILRKLDSRTTRFQIELQPAGLGRVGVDVQIAASGQISAALNFDSPQSAELLRGHAQELHAALEQAGFNLSGGGLSFTSGGQSQDFDQGGGQTGRSFAGHPAAQPPQAGGDASAALAASTYAGRSADGRLDIRI